MRNPNPAFYEWVSARYEDFYGYLDPAETVRQWMQLIAALRPDLLPNTGRRVRLLDLGCGPGWHLAAWAASGFDVAGVDSSPNMVRLAKSHLQSLALQGVPVLESDVLSPACRSLNSFHLVVAHTNFFHLFPAGHFRKVGRALAELMRPPGLLMFDWTSAALATDGAVDVRLDRDGRSWRVSGKLSADHRIYTQTWQHEAQRGRFERYWLHTTEQCDSILNGAGWRRIAARSWHPMDSRCNWRKATSRSRRLVLAYEFRGAPTKITATLEDYSPRTGVL